MSLECMCVFCKRLWVCTVYKGLSFVLGDQVTHKFNRCHNRTPKHTKAEVRESITWLNADQASRVCGRVKSVVAKRLSQLLGWCVHMIIKPPELMCSSCLFEMNMWIMKTLFWWYHHYFGFCQQEQSCWSKTFNHPWHTICRATFFCLVDNRVVVMSVLRSIGLKHDEMKDFFKAAMFLFKRVEVLILSAASVTKQNCKNLPLVRQRVGPPQNSPHWWSQCWCLVLRSTEQCFESTTFRGNSICKLWMSKTVTYRIYNIGYWFIVLVNIKYLYQLI